jgi:hypothetical protein
MYQVEDEPVETIHVYVVREGEQHPSWIPILLSLLALLALSVFCALVPYQQPERRKTLRLPAVPLPPITLTITEPIIATGIKAYPATTAHGTLTLTNGSVIAQELPAGLIFNGHDGQGVATDAAVFVPAGSASGYGFAAIAAHSTIRGRDGNIPSLDIDSVEGSSLYIRNLRPFTGGQDAYSVKFITPQDRQAALASGTAWLKAQAHKVKGILTLQSLKSVYSGATLRLTMLCRFLAWPQLPGFRITAIRIEGKELLVYRHGGKQGNPIGAARV